MKSILTLLLLPMSFCSLIGQDIDTSFHVKTNHIKSITCSGYENGVGSAMQMYKLEYDKMGRLIFKMNLVPSNIDMLTTEDSPPESEIWFASNFHYREEKVKFTYTLNGNLTTETRIGVDSNAYVYDKTNRKISSKTYSNKVYQGKTIYHYGNNGKLIRENNFNEKGIKTDSTTYKYDSRNNLIVKRTKYSIDSLFYDKLDSISRTIYYPLNGSWHTITTIKRDSTGKRIEKNEQSIYDSGNTYFLITEYDSLGRCVNFRSNYATPTKWFYNEKGILINFTENDPANAKCKDTKFTYNEKGDLIEKKVLLKSGKVLDLYKIDIVYYQ